MQQHSTQVPVYSYLQVLFFLLCLRCEAIALLVHVSIMAAQLTCPKPGSVGANDREGKWWNCRWRYVIKEFNIGWLAQVDNVIGRFSLNFT